jgi:uncharacterized protein with NRDE domain
MCLILLAWKMDDRFPLVLAANRDEFYERPSQPAAFWPEQPDLLAGRDLREGGCWLGITRDGRLSALTNFRDPASLKTGAPSRGHLVLDYLRERQKPEAYLDRIGPAHGYNGFNLLLGDRDGLFCFSNRGGRQQIEPGIHGLSNHLLDTSWPKVVRGKAALGAALAAKWTPETILAILADRMRPADESLPDTGVGLEWERILSPCFIESPVYGTRSSTVLTIDRAGKATFVERVFDGGAAPRTSQFSFHLTSEPGGGEALPADHDSREGPCIARRKGRRSPMR